MDDLRKLDYLPFMSPLDCAKVIYTNGSISVINKPRKSSKVLFTATMGEDTEHYWETIYSDFFHMVNTLGILGMLSKGQKKPMVPDPCVWAFYGTWMKKIRKAFNKAAAEGELVSESRFDPIPALGDDFPSKLVMNRKCTRILLDPREKIEFYNRTMKNAQAEMFDNVRRLEGMISSLPESKKKLDLVVIHEALVASFNSNVLFPIVLGDYLNNDEMCSEFAERIRIANMTHQPLLFGPKRLASG